MLSKDCNKKGQEGATNRTAIFSILESHHKCSKRAQIKKYLGLPNQECSTSEYTPISLNIKLQPVILEDPLVPQGSSYPSLDPDGLGVCGIWCPDVWVLQMLARDLDIYGTLGPYWGVLVLQ